MQNNNKRERILDAMQELMRTASAQAISVSDIAQKAGIGKGSIYYYFPSKNNIIDAVIERSYSRVLDAGRELAASSHMDAFKKMEIIYNACLDSSTELRRQEAIGTFNEQQESAFIHQKFAIIRNILECYRNYIRLTICTGCKIPHSFFQKFDYIFIQHKKYLLNMPVDFDILILGELLVCHKILANL